MSPPIALDVTRLFLGPLSVTPRGIDRVAFGYARHLLEEWDGECVATLPTPWGVQCFDRQPALRLVDFVERLWRETVEAEEDSVYQQVKAWLTGRLSAATSPGRARELGLGRMTGEFIRLILNFGFPVGRSAVRRIPSNAIYLNTGHFGLESRRALGWLDRRPDVKPVFMLHDTIPIENAEYVSPQSRQFHQKIVANTARYAAGIIVTTGAAGESVRREIQRCGRSDVAIGAVPLPVPPAFLGAAEPDPDLSGVPYFVICGAVDPRKNHLLLLKVWRELVLQDGPSAPKLVIIGPRHRTSDAVLDMLERCELIRDHVIEVSGMSSPGLRRILTGARALLMPSFAEGFGIPIIEALAVGTPVIASDLAAHREVGGNYVTYLSPIDGLGWLSAVRAHAMNSSSESDRRKRLESYRPWTWADYFRQVEPFIENLAHSRGERELVTSDGAGGPQLQVLANP
jgi:glycosyltransferase involved in cell wall biosynthesis